MTKPMPHRSVSSTQAAHALAVAHTRSFSKAAGLVEASQSAVSNSVATLEHTLGLTLFSRTTRQVTPTPSFRALRPRFERLLKAAEAIDSSAATLRGQVELRLRVGISPVVDADRIDPVVQAFEGAHPGLEVELVELNLAELARELDAGRLEVAIAPVAERRPRFRSVLLYREPLILVKAQRSSTGQPVALADLGAQAVVMVPDACGLARATVALFRRNRVVLRRAKTRALGYHLLERSALAGRGLAILPRSKLSSATAGSELVEQTGDHAMLAVHLMLRRGGRQSAAQRALVHAFTTAAAIHSQSR